MPGDYTRFSFQPWEDHLGVLMQQGRVMLDADWNEQIAILERRWRAQTIDTFNSHCIVPKETPHAFEIQLAGGSFTIGGGRCYVDGFLAENHGTGVLEFDRAYEESFGKDPIPYEEQPYFPNAEIAEPIPQGGTHLVYLDVWKREVTSLEEADLTEKAVGVDTATRWQTAWQVKLLPRVGPDVSCATPDEQIPDWLNLTRPSAGRLTTQAVGVPSSDDPCIIPPNGGYRGTENRLYRIEIHDAGELGTATFKWSRDNNSIGTNVTGLNTARDILTVVRTGRDAVLRFSEGDWVEVTDDFHEFAGEPGEMRKVQKVDDVQGTITLTAALPAGSFGANANELRDRHTRVRRWDQKGLIRDKNGVVIANVDASSGVIPIPAAPTDIILEDGVQVTFALEPVGGAFRVGDYWVFAARTADASVEELVVAPPRGIHHHYCRLAIITFPNQVLDCRTFWPPDFGGGESCDCDVCISAEDHNSGTFTLQMAIAQVQGTGGKICLGQGIFVLSQPLQITGARSVQLHGKGWTTLLLSLHAGPAVQIVNSFNTTLVDLAILAFPQRDQGQQGFTFGVGLLNAIGVHIERCVIAQLGIGEFDSGAIGMAGIIAQTFLRENLLFGEHGITSITGIGGDLFAARVFLYAANLYIEDNSIYAVKRGVNLIGSVAHLAENRIAGNLILKSTEIGIAATGAVASELLPGSRLDLYNNIVRMGTYGIVVGSSGCRIQNNDLVPDRIGTSSDVPPKTGEGAGILVADAVRLGGAATLFILGNRVIDINGHGIEIQATIELGMIKNNVISRVGGNGIAMTGKAQSNGLSIENNQIENLGSGLREGRVILAGILVQQTRQVQIADNTISGVGMNAVQARARAGILSINCDSIQISTNEVIGVGPESEFLGDTAGIWVVGTFQRADVLDNVVRRSLEFSELKNVQDNSRWHAIRIGEPQAQFGRGVSEYMPLVFVEKNVYLLAADRVFKRPAGRQVVAVRGNSCDGFGSVPEVMVISLGACIINDNRCLLNSERAPVVLADVGGAIMSSNYLEGGTPTQAVDLRVGSGPFTVPGNITTAPISVNSAALPSPWNVLNVLAV